MKVIVTGSRDWVDPQPIREALSALPPDTVVVHGGARGADRVTDSIARKLGLEVRVYVAQWAFFGRSAGFVRNQQMLDVEGPVDLVLAFPLPQSRGTWDMVERAKAAGVEVKVWGSKTEKKEEAV